MISRTVVSMSTAGLLVLAAGIAARRSQLTRGPGYGPGLDRAIALGRIFVAASLATFGGLHLAAAQGLSQMVPSWMPWRLFWAYLVGLALIATGLSLIFDRLVRWSALLAGVMLLAFVATLHVPNLVAHLHDRFAWAVFLRDTAFAAGLLALAGSAASPASGWQRLVTPGRLAFAVAALFFAVEHFLHPEFAPGVPLEKMAPWWALAPRIWGYLVGAVLLASGALLLVNRWAREAAACLGIVVTIVVVVIYVPMLWPAQGTDAVVEAIDYVADTLLFAGTALILAEALGAEALSVRQETGIRRETSNYAG